MLSLVFEKALHLLLPFMILLSSIAFCQGDVPPLTNVTVQPNDPSIYSSLCGPQMYCLPAAGAQWINGQKNLLRWNYQYPTFLSVGFVDVKLYTEDDDYTPIQQWLNITNSQGLLTYPDHNSSSITELLRSNYPVTQNVTGKNFYFTVSTPNDKTSVEKSPIFSIYDIREPYNPSSTIHPSPTPTPMSSPSSSTTTSMQPSKTGSESYPPTVILPPSDHTGLPGGAIAGIAIGSTVAFLLLGAIVLVLRKRFRKQQRVGYVNEKRKSNYGSKGGSIYLRRGNSSTSEVNSLSPLADISDPPRRHSLRLTVKDAQLLAHHYRTMLTKKTWGGAASEAQGTSYSDELLRRELAAEGCGVRLVSNAPAIVVVNDEGVASSEVMSVNPQVHEHVSMETGLPK